MKAIKVVIWSLGLLALGCAPVDSTGGGTAGTGSGSAGTNGTAGTSGSAGTTGSGGTQGVAGTTGSGGSATGASGATGSAGSVGTGSGGATGSAGATGSGGATGSAGRGGATGTGGTAGSTTGRGGQGGTAGSAGTGTAGSTTGRGGQGGTAGSAGTGGTATTGRGGSTAGTTGTGGGVSVSSTCRMMTWPSATGPSMTISSTMSVTNFDGMMGTVNGSSSFEDCSSGGQESTEPIIEVANGGSVRNVIFGPRVGDGIHCMGSCTIENVWFANICDDAITMLGGSGQTATIRNSGFKNARDKAIQHNGNGSTVAMTDIYVETAGKLYRSCGEGSGCGSTSAVRTVTATNIYAIGVGQLLGVSSNDRATLRNICAYRTPQICHVYQPGSDEDAPVGANMVGEGPSTQCNYTAADTHALVNRVNGAVSTDAMCTGPNSAKTGGTATACVSGFNTCLKPCAPGGYGFKQITCSGGMYAEAASMSCTPPSDATAAARLAMSNMGSATQMVTGNGACSSQWAWGRDSEQRYCVCVSKPGYYQTATYVWDCQTPWW